MSGWNNNYGGGGGGGGNYGGNNNYGGGGNNNYGGNYGGNNYEQGGYGGGGFQQRGNAGGGFSPGAGASPGNQKGAGRPQNQSLRPVTCKQVSESTQPFPDQPFQVDNADLSQFSIIGRIRSIVTQTTNSTYVIEDGTGELDFKVWQADKDGAEGGNGMHDGLSEGIYVRVIGQIRSFNQRKSYIAHSIQPVTDFNEITAHELDCIASSLYFKRGPPHLQSAGGNPMGTSMMGGPPGMFTGSAKPTGVNPYGIAPAPMLIDPALSGLTPAAQKVLMMVRRSPDTNEGVNVNTIVNACRAQGLGAEEVQGAVAYLVSEGHLYSTVDEDHVKATDTA